MGKRFVKGGLVLGRKANESVVLTCNGLTIVVTISEITGSKIKLHFCAPEEVAISRSELLPKVKELCNVSQE